MNRDTFSNQWPQIKSFIQDKWPNLTDDDIRQINGSLDVLISKLQQKYGYTRESAEEEVRNWNPRVTANARGDYRKSDADTNNILKWIAAIGIPLLLLGAWIAHRDNRVDDTTRTTVTNERTPTDYRDTTTTTTSDFNADRVDVNDRVIADRIRQAILNNASTIDIRNIQIENDKGSITLRGTVTTDQQRTLIENLVSRIPGVKTVNNEIEVK